jgi:3-oxoacyl-(acyl-carrier-protein) synthase
MEECGVFVGCAAGGPESIESSVADLVKSDVSRSTTLIRTMTNAAAAEISILHGCQGPNLTYAIACASSGYAIGEACNYITSGRGRLAIAGDAEAPMTYGLHRSRLLAGGADGQCRPFSKERRGHLLGAAGAVCALASLMAVRTGLIAPTVNFGTVDKDLDLDYVPNEARQLAVRHSLCNSFAFGGANSALIFSRI